MGPWLVLGRAAPDVRDLFQFLVVAFFVFGPLVGRILRGLAKAQKGSSPQPPTAAGSRGQLPGAEGGPIRWEDLLRGRIPVPPPGAAEPFEDEPPKPAPEPARARPEPRLSTFLDELPPEAELEVRGGDETGMRGDPNLVPTLPGERTGFGPALPVQAAMGVAAAASVTSLSGALRRRPLELPHGTEGWRQAWILREVLGRPRALQREEPPGWS